MPPVDEELEEERLGVSEEEADSSDVGDEESESEEGAPSPGKRRRPRRRRRGGKTRDEPDESPRVPRPKSPTSAEPIVVDLGPAGHDVEIFDDEDDDDDDLLSAGGDDDDDGDEASMGGSRPASHRNIPSWGEAIGVVVDANLAMRSERKKTARPPGASRGGRPRGRRKKRP